MTSWLLRDPSGVPIAQCSSTGSEYYYLFDGQGDVVALEDPGMVVASYDYCPTGNEADLGGGTNPMTAAGLGNPLRQGASPYDDGTKDYMSLGGTITEDYNGTTTQGPAITNGDCLTGPGFAEGGRHSGSPGIVPAHMPNAGGGGTVSYLPPGTDLNPFDNPTVEQAKVKCGQEGFKAGVATIVGGVTTVGLGIIVAGVAPEVVIPAALLTAIGASVIGCVHGVEDTINP